MAVLSDAVTTASPDQDLDPRPHRVALAGVGAVATAVAAFAAPATSSRWLFAALGWSEWTFVLLTVVAVVSAALLATAVAALTDNRRWHWVAAILWLAALGDLPADPLVGMSGLDDAVSARTALSLLLAAAAALALRPLWEPSRRTGRIVGVAALGSLAAARVAAGIWAAPTRALAGSPVVTAVLLAVAGLVACALVIEGVRSGSLRLTALGAGPGVVVVGYLRPDAGVLSLPVLRLFGAVMVVAGMLVMLSAARRSAVDRTARLTADLAALVVVHERLRHDVAERDHELRNGLAGLSALPALIDRPPPDAERGVLRSAVESELGRLSIILAGGEVGRTRYCVDGVVTEVTALHGPAATDVVVPADLWVEGRRSVLAQVLTNALINCARHAPGAAVQVGARRVGDRIRVEVRDDGPGPSGPRDRLVDPGTEGGAGLGLKVSRRLLAQEEARIAVEEAGPEGGCRVVVDLRAAG